MCFNCQARVRDLLVCLCATCQADVPSHAVVRLRGSVEFCEVCLFVCVENNLKGFGE